MSNKDRKKRIKNSQFVALNMTFFHPNLTKYACRNLSVVLKYLPSVIVIHI